MSNKKAKKTTGKKVTAKKASKAVAAVVVEESAELVDPTMLNEEAHKYFGQMQTSWFNFGKTLLAIKESFSRDGFGYGSFKEYCEGEFPSTSYSVMFKIAKVVESYGEAIEKKFADNPEYQLPAFQACYELQAKKDKLPTSDHTKLVKCLLDGKISYHKLSKDIKEWSRNASEKRVKEFSESHDVEDDLVEDLKDMNEDSEFEDAVVGDNADVNNLVRSVGDRINYLQENVPFLEVSLDDAELDNDDLAKVVELATEVEDLINKLNNLLTKVEGLSE